MIAEEPRRRALPLLLCLALFVPPALAAQGQPTEERWKSSPQRWLEREGRPGSRAPTVKGYLAEMEWKHLPQEVVLVAGSATAWMWNAEKWFSEYRTVNRGFGGSRIDDNTYFAERLILPYRPSTIVLYAGDNDLWARKPPALTAQHFRDFVTEIRSALPHTQIVFVSIRPSIARWEIWEEMQEANRLIRAYVEAEPDLYYADIVPVTLGSDGKPRPELFIEDDLHLTELGYLEWTRVVKPLVAKAEARYRELAAAAGSPASSPGSD